MGIRFTCPNGHKLNVKTFLAGKRGVCPQCGAKFVIPGLGEAATPAEAPLDGAGGTHNGGPPQTAVAASSTASQSITIPVAEAVQSESPAPPAADVPGPQVIAEPTGLSAAGTKTRNPRESRRRKQLAISIILLILVVVLAVVFIWVLKRDSGQQPAKKVSADVSRTQIILGVVPP